MSKLDSGLEFRINEVVKDFTISIVDCDNDEMATRVKIWKNLVDGRFLLIPELTLRLPNEYSGYYTRVEGHSEDDVIAKYILATERKLTNFHHSMNNADGDQTRIVVNQEWMQPNKCWLD